MFGPNYSVLIAILIGVILMIIYLLIQTNNIYNIFALGGIIFIIIMIYKNRKKLWS